ncbi:hypothetical protein I4U23_004057 [Adineta vaga]|nr:hypothetical protein I4U23_004057 [Adineta vaga]
MSSLSITLSLIQKPTLFGLSCFFVTFGLTGCILNIFLFSQKQFRTTSCCKYFFFASIAMLFNLLMYSIPAIYGYFYANPITYNVPFCKCRAYVIHVMSIIFRFLLCAASFDRFALSSSNARLRQMSNVKFAYPVIALIIIILPLIHIYMLVFYNIKSNNCYNSLDTIGITIANIYSLCNTSILPLTLMTIFSVGIRKNLAEKQKRRQDVLNPSARIDQTKQIQLKRDQQVLKMLFSQIIAFVIVTLPYMIYSTNNIVSPYIQNKSSDQIAIENFIAGISGGFSYVFPAISFYLYTLTSSMFRKELWRMLRSTFCWSQNHRIEPIITTTNRTHQTNL